MKQSPDRAAGGLFYLGEKDAEKLLLFSY